MTAGSPFFVVTDLTVCYIVGMVVMNTNSEIYTSMASSLLTFITICRLTVLKSQMEFLIQVREITNGIFDTSSFLWCSDWACSDVIPHCNTYVLGTLPTSSSTVNSLTTAGSAFFVVTDLTVCYIVGMVLIYTNSEIYTSMASSLLTFITICRLNVLKSQMEFLIQVRFYGVVTEPVAMSFHIVTHTYTTNIIFDSQFFNDFWFCILCSNWFDCLLHSWHVSDGYKFRNIHLNGIKFVDFYNHLSFECTEITNGIFDTNAFLWCSDCFFVRRFLAGSVVRGPPSSSLLSLGVRSSSSSWHLRRLATFLLLISSFSSGVSFLSTAWCHRWCLVVRHSTL